MWYHQEQFSLQRYHFPEKKSNKWPSLNKNQKLKCCEIHEDWFYRLYRQICWVSLEGQASNPLVPPFQEFIFQNLAVSFGSFSPSLILKSLSCRDGSQWNFLVTNIVQNVPANARKLYRRGTAWGWVNGRFLQNKRPLNLEPWPSPSGWIISLKNCL